jgi:predicted tellurium resistance membrane protein TerC
MAELLTDPQAWLALVTLTALELVLGIDNVVFIAILTDRLPVEHRSRAYRLGLGGALVTRVLLLLTISWVMGLTAGLFTVLGEEISGRDLILLVGGVFLIGKSSHEIYEKVEGESGAHGGSASGTVRGMWGVVAQIMVLDIVFSLDSVITAVGMVDQVPVMVAAIAIAIIVMMASAQRLGDFVNRNPTMKILALSFLLLIGVLLTAEAFDQHINKGYIYFAMGFAVIVEMLNMRFRRRNPRPSDSAAGGA